MEAPLPQKDNDSGKNIKNFRDEIKEKCKNILEKYLEGRKLNKDKIKNWGDSIIEDIEQYLTEKYPYYGFGISFYISDITAFTSNANCIYFTSTDDYFVQPYNTKDFYSEIRVFANKIHSKVDNFADNMPAEYMMKINQKLRDILENRTFVYDNCVKWIKNIVDDVNSVILKRPNRPCSYHIGFINALPTKNLYFTYKFIKLEYMPFFFSYSNDSLLNSLYLFVVNN